MQSNKDQSQWSIACPTQNQCKIHEVYASRIEDPAMYKCEVLKIYNQHLKVLKKMIQSSKINTSTEY